MRVPGVGVLQKEMVGSLFVCGGSLTSGQLVKGSFQTA